MAEENTVTYPSLFGSRFEHRLERTKEKLDRLHKEDRGAFNKEMSLHWQALLHAWELDGDNTNGKIGETLLMHAQGFLDYNGDFEDEFMQLVETIKENYEEEGVPEEPGMSREEFMRKVESIDTPAARAYLEYEQAMSIDELKRLMGE